MVLSFENKRVRIRAVEVEDAAFILSLRTDHRLNQHVSQVDGDEEKQREWIKAYKLRENEGVDCYFIVEDLEGTKFGTCRTYDIDFIKSTASVGSWVISPDAPFYMAFDSLLIGYKFVFNTLNIDTILLDVRKENSDSLRTVEKKLGATHVGKDSLNDYYELKKESFEHALRTRLKGYIRRAFGEENV